NQILYNMVTQKIAAFFRVMFRNITFILICATVTVNVSAQGNSSKEEQFYQLKKVSIPSGIVLEVGGLTFDDKGRLAVCTRRGEIWIIEKPDSPKPIYKRFAHGLHEPLGLAFKDGAFYCAQRGELSKIVDTDKDDIADSYETV